MRDFRDAKTMAHALQERQARSHGPPLCMLPLRNLFVRAFAVAQLRGFCDIRS
jgi:hypothetical protein